MVGRDCVSVSISIAHLFRPKKKKSENMAAKSKSKTKEIVSEAIPSSEVDVQDIEQNILPFEGRKQSGYQDVPTENIITGMNIRSEFLDEAMVGLVESIRVHGILEPLIVNKQNDGSTYVLIAGERRFRAALSLEMGSVPCKVFEDLSESEVFDIMLTENLLRADLNPIEEAIGLKKLIDVGMKQEDLGKRIGRSQEYVANRVRLLDSPGILQQKIISREITPSHVALISKYSSYPWYSEFVDHYVKKNEKFAKKEGSSIPVRFIEANTKDFFYSSGPGASYAVSYPFCGYYESKTPEGKACLNCSKMCGNNCIDMDCYNKSKETIVGSIELLKQHEEEERKKAAKEEGESQYEKERRLRREKIDKVKPIIVDGLSKAVTDVSIETVNSFLFDSIIDRYHTIGHVSDISVKEYGGFSFEEKARYALKLIIGNDLIPNYEFDEKRFTTDLERYVKKGIVFPEEIIALSVKPKKKKDKGVKSLDWNSLSWGVVASDSTKTLTEEDIGLISDRLQTEFGIANGDIDYDTLRSSGWTGYLTFEEIFQEVLGFYIVLDSEDKKDLGEEFDDDEEDEEYGDD